MLHLAAQPTSKQRTLHASGAKYCPRQGKSSCRVPQPTNFKPRWRRISTRQLIEALPQDKASARAAPRCTPTSMQRTSPVRCHPAASHHASGAKYSPRQGKCSCRFPQHPNFNSRYRRIPGRQSTEAQPKTRPVFVLPLAAHQLQSRAPVQCDSTMLQFVMPAEHRIAQDKASARAAPSRTTTSNHAGGGSQPAS